MNWNPICTNPTKAARRYQQRFAAVMVFYLLVVFWVTRLLRPAPPSGLKLYFYAALPTLPVLAMLLVMGQYLREEQDEFKRMLLVRSILWAIAATFVVSTYADFLRTLGHHEPLAPFLLFTTFWVVMAVVQGIQAVANRAPVDE